MSPIMLEDLNIELVQLVEQAVKTKEETTILSGTIPVAKLVPVPVEEPKEPRKGGFGSAKHILIYMADDSDAPLDDFKDYM